MAGAIQGIVMGILLWRSKSSPQWKANRFLALILFFFAYRLITETLYSLDIIGYKNWLYHVFLEYNWIYGGLIYFYVISLIQPKFKLERKHWIHFLPVALEFAWSNFIKSQNFFWDGTAESLTWLGYHGYILWMHTPFQIVIAIGLVLYYTIRLRHQLIRKKIQTSTPLKPSARLRILWTLNAYIAFSILSISFSSVDYLFYDYAFNPFYKYPTFIGMALLAYWLGIQGIWYRNETIFEKAPKKVTNSEELKQIIQELKAIMLTQKPYLNPELNVAALAKIINTKPYLLTKALNQQLQKKFSDYINEFRVQEVKERINHPDYDNKTLLAIAYDSGFNSKASFNRIVKKITGQSPSQLKSK